MKTRKPMIFETVPSWAIDATEKSRYTIAAAIELAGFTDKWIRLSAESQRQLFGVVMFGKANVMVTNKGISAYRSVCFGTDFSSTNLDWSEVEKHIANGTQVVF